MTDNWISIYESLPGIGETVKVKLRDLIYDYGVTEIEARLTENQKHLAWESEELPKGKPRISPYDTTHWHPLPAPPEAE